MKEMSAHQEKWKIIDLFVGVPIVLSIILQIVFSINLIQDLNIHYLLIALGCFIMLIGIIIVIQTRRELSKYNQPTEPGQITDKIVKTGPYSISRNPLNLGAVIFYIGLGLILRNTWFFLLLIPVVLLCTLIFIIPEEKYLKTKFGKTYDEYKSSVNRWIGN